MLTVIVITKNEEDNIRRCLESVSWADEIIVVDSGSTDKTIDIALEFTDKVTSRDWLGYGIQKQRALELATSDWVLNLDADESIGSDLHNEIKQAILSHKADAYRIPVQMYFYEKPMRYSSSPSRHIRLYKRLGASYSDDIVHEKIILEKNSRVAQLKAPILHHSVKDVSHVLYKINHYSSYSAKVRLNNPKNIGMTRIIFSAIWMFFRSYLLQKGFMDGREGFLFAIFKAQESFYRGVKQLYPDRQIKQLP